MLQRPEAEVEGSNELGPDNRTGTQGVSIQKSNLKVGWAKSFGSSSWGQKGAQDKLKGSCKVNNQTGIKGQGEERIKNPYQQGRDIRPQNIMNTEGQG